MKIDKISFSAFESEALMRELDGLSESERDGAEEIIGAYTSPDDIEEVAFSISHGSLTVRCYDGEDYSFSFPYEICEGADLSGAVGAVVRYAMLEEVSPVFEGVPRECISLFFDLGYRHINLDSDSPDSETYRVTLKSECDLLGDHPEAACEEITLSRIVESDLSDYARLVRDEKNNKYWGYDFHEDFSDFEDSFWSNHH